MWRVKYNQTLQMIAGNNYNNISIIKKTNYFIMWEDSNR